MAVGRTVAVVGASGLVGREMIRVLEERRFPAEKLLLFSSSRSQEEHLLFRGRKVPTVPLGDGWWEGVDLAFFATGNEVSRREVPRAAAAGVIVVDNSSAFRLDDGVPLVVPEVNVEDLARHRGIIANPNCCAVELVLALAPLEREARLTRVVVSTYQSVSGAGRMAEEALIREAKGILHGEDPPAGEATPFPRRIGFNLFPQVGSFDETGWCGEERKIRDETRKILHRPDLPVSATVVRVPVFRGHGEAVVVETERPLSAEGARAILARSPGVELSADAAPGGYPTPAEAAGTDSVLVGRVRSDPDLPRCLHLWVVGDNLRKGAALNAVQVAEELVISHETARARRGGETR